MTIVSFVHPRVILSRLTFWLAAIFLPLALFIDANACSCSSAAFAPACQLVSTTEVVFLGECLELVGKPGYGNAKLYKYRVEKVYKGLPVETKEIMVDSGAGTSCETTYSVGTRYLMFAGTPSNNPLQVSAWICSGSREAERNKEDVAFLEQYSKGKSVTEVFGKVLQWVSRFGFSREEESAALDGAEVKLEGSTGSFSSVTKADGSFRFTGITPGEYLLTASLPLYGQTPPYGVKVSSGACNQVFLQLSGNASIKGNLLAEDGKPAANKRVEILRQDKDGKWASTTQMWKQTDSGGNFHFEGMPSGSYLLGYEIDGDRPSDSSAHPTQYYPGVSDRSQAEILVLSPQQHLEGLKLTLPPPHTERKITIRVIWPDERPIGSNLLQISTRSGFLKNLRGDTHNGVVTFEGYQEREYEISARYWIDDLGDNSVPHENKRIALSDKIKVAPGKEPVEIVLVLKREMLGKDDN